MTTLNADNQLIFDFIQHTNQPIFLTGKAGTGKTTLLHYIKKNVSKELAIVAPTAVAAINAGGVTLHSFFQIPFGPSIPARRNDVPGVDQKVNFSYDKIKLLQCLELLIIDEISMVRADTLDYIDATLKKVKASNRPFGGVQVLMIGDLYQLPPVAHQDWPVLKAYYKSPYFFDSHVFQSITMLTFELNKVYRQSDPLFINILNGIRNDHLEDDLLGKLNERYDAFQSEGWKDDYITLTTHNQLVTELNQQRLEALEGPLYSFAAVINGDFPKDGYPTDENLQLKEGAQVMFTKNDSSGKKQYYNGRTGKITAIDGETIQIQFIDDHSEIQILPEIWQNVKYSLDNNVQKITETNTGSFTQYPIKLAWAITIHKSQGLTFEKAIVDISSAFAHGQVYVALSRCRSLEGLILRAPLKPQNIITDAKVIAFMEQATHQKPDELQLDQSTGQYERGFIDDLMDYTTVSRDWSLIGGFISQPQYADGQLAKKYEEISQIFVPQIITIANRFVKMEISKFPDQFNLIGDTMFLARLQKASSYFIPKIEQVIKELKMLFVLPWHYDFPAETLTALLNNIITSLLTKLAVYRLDWESFSPQDCIKAIHKVQVDYFPMQKGSVDKVEVKEKEIENIKLYESLLTWRKELSTQRKVLDYAVLSDKSLQAIAAKLPKSTEELAAIAGVGRGNTLDFGMQIIKIVNSFRGVSELF